VDVVESYTFPSKDRGKTPPVVLSNFPVVDKNGVFMHGVAALQELVRRHGSLQHELKNVEQALQDRKTLFDGITTKLAASASEKQTQRKALAEATLKNEQTRFDIERKRVVDDEEFVKLSLQEEKEILDKQEALLNARHKAVEEMEKEKFERTSLLEKELNEAALQRMISHSEDLQAAQGQIDAEFDERKLSLEKERIQAETER